MKISLSSHYRRFVIKNSSKPCWLPLIERNIRRQTKYEPKLQKEQEVVQRSCKRTSVGQPRRKLIGDNIRSNHPRNFISSLDIKKA